MLHTHRFGVFEVVLSLAITGASALAAQEYPAIAARDRDKVPARAIELEVYLQLHGHPDTALRAIEVRARKDRVELRGAVTNEHERDTAERLTALVVSNTPIVNRLRIVPPPPPPPPSRPGAVSELASPAVLEQRFLAKLAQIFSEEITNRVQLTVYPIPLSSMEAPPSPKPGPNPAKERIGWVAVLEGTVPSAHDQLAMNEALLYGPVPAAAVVNRTHIARHPSAAARPGLQVRVPFFGLDLDVDRGIDLDVYTPAGPIGVRSGGRGVAWSRTDDESLTARFLSVVESDPALQDAQLTGSAFAGVLMIDGKLTAADKMRVVVLAQTLSGLRGIVDRTGTIDGAEAFYDEQDLAAYLRYRLGEHAVAWDIETKVVSTDRITVRATVPTPFHATLAAAVIAQDPAVSTPPLELNVVEWQPSITRSARR